MSERERDEDEGFGYGEGEETHESPETLSPDERNEDPDEAQPGFHEPKEP
jgi:hypothetical protein